MPQARKAGSHFIRHEHSFRNGWSKLMARRRRHAFQPEAAGATDQLPRGRVMEVGGGERDRVTDEHPQHRHVATAEKGLCCRVQEILGANLSPEEHSDSCGRSVGGGKLGNHWHGNKKRSKHASRRAGEKFSPGTVMNTTRAVAVSIQAVSPVSIAWSIVLLLRPTPASIGGLAAAIKPAAAPTASGCQPASAEFSAAWADLGPSRYWWPRHATTC